MLIQRSKVRAELAGRASLPPRAWRRQLACLAAGLMLLLLLATPMPAGVVHAQSSAVDTSHVKPMSPATRRVVRDDVVTVFDYHPDFGPHPECGMEGGVCVPFCLMRPECMAFDSTALPGLGGRAATDSVRFGIYCYPPSGVPADSLILFVWPCSDPAGVQVRLYDGHGTLVDILSLKKICVETCEVMRHQIKGPRRPYQLEVAGHGLRRWRQIILGS